MKEFIKETEYIYRLKIPFDTVYTSVFLIELGEGLALVDCATTSTDVDGYIAPALSALGYSLFDIDYLVITHNHSDHAGGLARICELAPTVTIVREVRALSRDVSTYSLPGHTEDFIGVFDSRSKALISGDGLQGAGVDKYRCSLQSKSAYIKTLEKIKEDESIEILLFSHAYEPWYKDSLFGRENVTDCLLKCAKYAKQPLK